MKFRDFLAVPFWATAQLLEYISIVIGGAWTARMMVEQATKVGELFKEE